MSSLSTSIEQSKRLLDLGLKPETADCCWAGKIRDWEGKEIENPRYRFCENYKPNGWIVQNFEEVEVIPSWSLYQLVSLIDSKGITLLRNGWIYDLESEIYYQKSSDVLDNLIDCIEFMIEGEEFSYLHLVGYEYIEGEWFKDGIIVL